MLKMLSDWEKEAVVLEVKLMLFASRDAMWTRFKVGLSDVNPVEYRFDSRDGYHGEAFGVMRGLALLGYGYFGSNTLPGDSTYERGRVAWHNLSYWFSELEREVMGEEDGTREKTVANLKKYRVATVDHKKNRTGG